MALDATTIVILQSEGQLILAADSKRRYEQGGETLFEATACKLLVLGDVVFAASGFTALAGADGQGLFDVRALAGRMLSQPVVRWTSWIGKVKKPITVRWRLRSPLSAQLAGLFMEEDG